MHSMEDGTVCINKSRGLKLGRAKCVQMCVCAAGLPCMQDDEGRFHC